MKKVTQTYNRNPKETNEQWATEEIPHDDFPMGTSKQFINATKD